MRLIIFPLLLFLILPLPLTGGTAKTAVVKNRFDDMGRLLALWHIPYTEIGPETLNRQETYGEYEAIFFPCGMEPPLHERMSVIAAGRSIASVSLNENTAEIDEERAAAFMRSFVKNGGMAYFSGSSFRYVQAAFENPLSFFSGLPYIGESDFVEANLGGDMRYFCGTETTGLNMGGEGWIAVRDTSLGEVLAEGFFETPLGRQRGPIAALFALGQGEAIYTSCYGSAETDFTRFIVYRLLCAPLIRKGVSEAEKWEQTVTARLADALHGRENARSCLLPLEAGHNSLYIVSDAGGFQADVLDGDGSLMYSGETRQGVHVIDLYAGEASLCRLRMFPDRQNRFQAFAAVAASGVRIIPYYVRSAVISAFAGILIFTAYMLISNFSRRRGCKAGGKRKI